MPLGTAQPDRTAACWRWACQLCIDFAEASIFSIIALLIGGLGANIVAGHQIALNFSSLVFMLPYSLGMATTVRVGQNLGAGRPSDAAFAAWVAMGSALLLACISASYMTLLREPIARIYTNDPQVLGIAATLIIYAAIFQFSDAIQVTAAGALRGYQDTRITMLITLASYWGIGLPVGYSLGLTSLSGPAQGPAGLWQGLIAGLTCAAVCLAGDWHMGRKTRPSSPCRLTVCRLLVPKPSSLLQPARAYNSSLCREQRLDARVKRPDGFCARAASHTSPQ